MCKRAGLASRAAAARRRIAPESGCVRSVAGI